MTSPLRRYQDLLAHMQIRAFLAGATNGAGQADSASGDGMRRAVLDSDEISRRCALAQAASAATRQAERASDLHWTLAYLLRHPDWAGESIIVGPAGAGAWQAFLPELGLETRLRLGSEWGGSRAPLDEVIRVRLVRAELASLESSFEEYH